MSKQIRELNPEFIASQSVETSGADAVVLDVLSVFFGLDFDEFRVSFVAFWCPKILTRFCNCRQPTAMAGQLPVGSAHMYLAGRHPDDLMSCHSSVYPTVAFVPPGLYHECTTLQIRARISSSYLSLLPFLMKTHPLSTVPSTRRF